MKRCISCGTPPQPYYVNDKNSVTQDHAAIFNDTRYAAGVCIPEQFVVPELGEDVAVIAKNLTNIVVGSYLWSPAYGYLKISSWDSCEKVLGLLNEEISGAAIPGIVVAEGSCFAVTARPCCADQDNFSLFPFLAEDFVAPSVTNSVTITVTSTFGLIVGTYVRIGTGVYFLETINSTLEVVIRNDGAGAVAGTTVEARDVNGNLQYLITSEAASACTASGADIGRLVICDGITSDILDGDFAGQIPVLINSTTDEVEFQLLDTQERVCTTLTSVFNIVAATQAYTIDVADESIFAIGEILQINFHATLRWEVTDNTTPGELGISCVGGPPGVNLVVATGSVVCLQLCCQTLTEEVDVLYDDVADLQAADEAIIVGIQNQQYTFAVSTGSANAQVVALTPPLASAVEGQTFMFRAGYTNTSGMTINAGFGVASVLDSRTNSALIGGEVIAGKYYIIVDTGGAWKLLNASNVDTVWTPTPVPLTGSMGSLIYDSNSYTIDGKWCTFQFALRWAQATATAFVITIPFPVTAVVGSQAFAATMCQDGTNYYPCVAQQSSTTNIQCFAGGAASGWTVGASRALTISGAYKIA